MRKIYQPGRSNILSNNAMVATSQPLSSQEAINILKSGGNAVDAAIAASAVLSVIEPGSTGIGGDCFAIVNMNDSLPVAINGSGSNPYKANLNYDCSFLILLLMDKTIFPLVSKTNQE